METYEKTPEQLQQARISVLFMTESALGQRYVDYEENPTFDLRKQVRALEQRRDTLMHRIRNGE